MPPSQDSKKRKKRSGLTRLELSQAYKALKDMKAALKVVNDVNEAGGIQQNTIAILNEAGDPENVIVMDPHFDDELQKMLDMTEGKLDGPQAVSFSGLRDDDLTKLNIIYGGRLIPKAELDVRAAKSAELGKNEHWSSDGLYRHLCLLKKLVPRANEAAARIWIDAFFFRASAMVPDGKQLVLSVEQNVPSTAVNLRSSDTLSGYIDYAAVTADTYGAEDFLFRPRLSILKDNTDHRFLVAEAKTRFTVLEGHVPQTLGEMYATAKQLGKDIIRGAVTEGQAWIFLILKINPDGNGGVYLQSQERIELSMNEPEISRIRCDVISGIIAYWIDHSYESIGDDDWFRVRWVNDSSKF
ncbi:hypothetical protein BYT27DRAFT_7188131 [Phlegmacium glaucopus]|nr:hypothetical protein BYT27DRAFT_7188131 [Phlegmacium glaucopus]